MEWAYVPAGPSHGKLHLALKPGKLWSLLAVGAVRMYHLQGLQLSWGWPEGGVIFPGGLAWKGREEAGFLLIPLSC